jgi:precorrin-6A/cobalt-precorrin-6A reductase
VPQDGDQWTEIESEEDATAHITKGQTVFLGTGRQTLERFANLQGCRVICRQIDPPSGPFPFEGGAFLVGRPPFPVADEVALFQKLNVDWLVVKNAGGARSASKLIAARQLGIPVLMIRRPVMPAGKKLSTVAEAIAWVVAHV